MAEIDYRDIPAPGLGVGAGLMRAMRRPEVAPLRAVPTRAQAEPQRREPVFASTRVHPEPEAPPAAAPGLSSERAQRAVSLAGAAVSLGLLVGLGVWGYDLAVRDVSGVPVIRAMEGPARVAPEDPGGELARHQGLAVNAVTADGVAAPPPDRLTLAPKPSDLEDGDVATAALLAEGHASAAVAETEPLTGEPLGSEGRIVDPLTAGPIEILPESVPGIARAQRPIPRPGTEVASAGMADPGVEDAMVAAALAAATASVAPSVTEELDPAAIPAGTRLVQIGTYESEDAARAGWDQIAAAHGEVMEGKRRVIEPAGTEGSVFFRLRAEGFVDIADARRFCSVIEDQAASCVPALVR